MVADSDEKGMTFDNQHFSSTCDCLDGSSSNTEDWFCRRVDIRAKAPKDRHFRTKDEKITDRVFETCKEECDKKGLSIYIWNDETKGQIKAVTSYGQGLEFSKKQLCIFRLAEGAGQLKPDPLKDNPSHYLMYKADNFSVNMLTEYKYIEIPIV